MQHRTPTPPARRIACALAAGARRFHRTTAAIAVALVTAACGGGSGATAPVGTTPVTPPPSSATGTRGPAPALHVQGNTLVDTAGRTVRLHGVNRSGTEYACIQGYGIFDGPSDSASVAAIAAWNTNAVRVPLNESCWLALDGVKPQYSGATYQQAIADYVARLNRAGLVAILDLHWTGPGTTSKTGQAPMPNRDRTPEFWRQVAQRFGTNDAVIFDLFNEPWPDSNRDTPEAWRCWRDGGTCAGVSYTAAGMQELVTAVRGAGATNVLLLGGVEYAASLSGWLAARPTDPRNNLVAAWHVYSFSGCNVRSCWDATAAPVAAQAPLLLSEIGEDDGGSAFVGSLMDWMDAHQGSGYLPWSWDVWGTPMDLVSNYDGTATTYGATFRTRFSH
ncbi:MAG TPA: cellulase family glycosylhydrolase [Gemmatirosa sp.]